MKQHNPVLLRKSSQYEHRIDTYNRYFINHKADIQKLFILKPVRQLAGTPSKHKPGTVLNRLEPLFILFLQMETSAGLPPKRDASFLEKRGFLFDGFMGKRCYKR